MAKDIDIHLMKIVAARIAVVRSQIFPCFFDVLDIFVSHFQKPSNVVFDVIVAERNRVSEWLGVFHADMWLLFHNKSGVVTILFGRCVILGLLFAAQTPADVATEQQFPNREMLHHFID